MRHAAATAAVAVLLLRQAGALAAPNDDTPMAPTEGPPSAFIVPERAFLTLGVDEGTVLAIQIDGEGAAGFLPVRVEASVGTVDPPASDGDGRFVARYHAPQQRFPQVAIVVVELARGAQRVRGVLRLPLRGSTEMPFRTNPHAEVTLRISEHTFGPIVADSQGRVKIPIVVPPGIVEGVARATDRDGNVTETLVDLQPAPFPRVLVFAPTEMEVGSTRPVSVYAVDPSGAPVPESRITLKAAAGQVRRAAGGSTGEARFLVQAPRLLGASPLVLTGMKVSASAKETTKEAGVVGEVSVPLVAGRPRKLLLTASAGWLVVGTGGGSTITLTAEDEFGNPTSCGSVGVSVNHQPAKVTLSEWGRGTIVVATPPRYEGRDGIVVEASLGAAYAVREIRLTGGPPTQLTLELSGTEVVADGKQGVEVRVHAVDQHGTPTLIPGLSWEVAGGRLGTVRKPRVGSYVADFVPRRVREGREETIAVMASQTLRASATFRVEPPRPRLLLTPRVGLYSNLGNMAGGTASVDVVVPLPGFASGVHVGVSLGYLHDAMTAGKNPDVRPHLEIYQVPVLAIARYRLLLRPVELSVGGGAGVSLAYSRLSLSRDNNPLTVAGTAQAVALQASSEAAFRLPPGHVVVGLRYLWIDLGRTSQGDELKGNSAGFVADLGYRVTW
jgi:hypothetical protein